MQRSVILYRYIGITIILHPSYFLNKQLTYCLHIASKRIRNKSRRSVKFVFCCSLPLFDVFWTLFDAFDVGEAEMGLINLRGGGGGGGGGSNSINVCSPPDFR